MVHKHCNLSGMSSFLRMNHIKDYHCCGVKAHSCGFGSVWTSIGGYYGGSHNCSIGNSLLSGIGMFAGLYCFSKMGDWTTKGISWLFDGVSGLFGNKKAGDIDNGGDVVKDDKYFARRYGGTRATATTGTEPAAAAQRPAPEEEKPDNEITIDSQIADYSNKIKETVLSKDDLTKYKTELEKLLNSEGLTESQRADIEKLLDQIDAQLEILKPFYQWELESLAKINKDYPEYNNYENAKPEDLIGDNAKVLYARDIVGQKNGTIGDVVPQKDTQDKVDISPDGETITIHDSSANPNTVTYDYVNTVNGEALYRSKNGQLYVLQKITSTGEYVLNQYEWHYGSGEQDVSSASA